MWGIAAVHPTRADSKPIQLPIMGTVPLDKIVIRSQLPPPIASLRSKLLAVHGRWQREGEVRNVIAARLEDLTPLLGRLADVAGGQQRFSLIHLDNAISPVRQANVGPAKREARAITGSVAP
jgi:hypothetical protein